MARRLCECGVNDLLLSVDAFHQETIPLRVVLEFARAVTDNGVQLRLSPAWLVSPDDDNPYNMKTREILAAFSELGVRTGEGNVVFPEGNALKYLSEYFVDKTVDNPYIEDPCNVKCISFLPNGDVLGGNIYSSEIADIMDNYKP